MIGALVVKEARAQAPAFAAALIAVVAAAAFTRFRPIGTIAYFGGAAALGALSIGHEYSYRTLGALLAQPVRRHRLLLAKLGVLAPMLFVLSVVAGAANDAPPPEAALAFAVLPVLAGLFIAPWLTMVCRGPLGGTVFTLSLPGMILSGSGLVYLALYGHGPAPGFNLVVASRATLAVSAIGLVMTWPTFLRLEAIDGPGPTLHLPHWLRRPTAAGTAAPAFTARNPVWQLVTKELRLQQITFAVMGFYLAGWVALTLSLRSEGIDPDEVFAGLTVPYSALIAVLIGSLASAEERRLGTLEWQQLLPFAAWRQWTIKVATIVILALLLGIGVPTLLAVASGMHAVDWLRPTFAAVVALLTIGALYVSSLGGSGVMALLASLPALMGAGLLVEWLFTHPGAAVFRMVADASAWPSPRLAPRPSSLRALDAMQWLIVAGVVTLVLWFGLTNHRSADRAMTHLRTQVVWLAVALTLAVTLLSAARALLWIPL